MKRVPKPVFFIVSILIVVITLLSLFGFKTTYGDKETVYIRGGNDIRWGIDIRGGVDVTFTPPEGVEATESQMDAAKEVINSRLVSLNITDSEVYVDYNKYRIIVRFPWKEGETDFDPQAAIEELGDTAVLTFREGKETDSTGAPSGVTAENIIIDGEDVKEAYPYYNKDENSYGVSLELNDSGKAAFAEATTRLSKENGVISIWMDDNMISYPSVNTPITDGKCQITGNFTAEEATSLANKINSGALPFKLVAENYSTINPTMGLGARDVMLTAGAIAFMLVCIYMIVFFRLPGVVSVFALMGQVACSIAAISGFFGFMSSFTLTLPGIAGVILGVGMGVDANVITFTRIKEEVCSGKSIDGAITIGYSRAFSAILDGNLTTIITAIILMGSFGPTDSLFAKMLHPVFFMFGASTAGTIYSFGYTLLVGCILNFVFGVTASRLMLQSLSRYKFLRKPYLYGGVKK